MKPDGDKNGFSARVRPLGSVCLESWESSRKKKNPSWTLGHFQLCVSSLPLQFMSAGCLYPHSACLTIIKWPFLANLCTISICKCVISFRVFCSGTLKLMWRQPWLAGQLARNPDYLREPVGVQTWSPTSCCRICLTRKELRKERFMHLTEQI